MTLTLHIENIAMLDNGVPTELVLHRRGAVVGRAATCDWPLPDPTRHLSSRHFEIRFDGRGYQLVDCSTNGTLLAATGQRLAGPHPIADGDRFQAGPYRIAARLSGEAGVAAAPIAAEPAPAWRGWDDGAAAESPGGDPSDTASGGWHSPPVAMPDTGARWQPQLGPSLARPEAHRAAAGWDRPSAASGSPSAPAPAASGWVPTAAAPPPPVTSAWDTAAPAPSPASGWSSAAPERPAASSPDDLWGRIAEGNVVDWARGGFGQPVEPAGDPLGLSPAPASAALPAERPRPPVATPTREPWPASPAPPVERAPPATAFPSAAAWPAAPAPPADASPPPPAEPPRAPPPPAANAFVKATGIDPARIDDPDAVAARGGALFRHLIAGLVVMLEARARAKSQLGAEATAFSPEGHNPLKFARTPDEALALLLGTGQPGFMPSERAVEDAFRDLQSHQVATLRAMQGALRATLERFSPAAIRARANAGGVIERIVPAARDAALWQAYEREFGGVAQRSDEAFLDTFAKEFRQAYNEQSRRGPA